MKALQGFVKVWDRLIDGFMVLAGILFWVQMLIVNIEVFSRYFLTPTIWVAEISSIIILWICFLVPAWVLRKDAHVRMDLVLQRLKPKTQAMINFFTCLAGVVVMLIVAGAGLMTTIYWIGNKTLPISLTVARLREEIARVAPSTGQLRRRARARATSSPGSGASSSGPAAPSRAVSTRSHSESALTTLTPTPCRPPETL